MKKARIITKQYDEKLAEQLARELSVSLPVAKLLLTRNLNDRDSAMRFLHPELSGMHNPFELKDMDKAVSIVLAAIERQDKICIYGDYDVDGITATSVLYLFLKKMGAQVSYFLPDRMKDGYGLNERAIREIADKGTQLIITVDTGISAVKEVKLAKELGMKIVVTDHHECQEKIPVADAVIDPKRPDDTYPFKQIAGVGVAFKLITAISRTVKDNPQFPEINTMDYIELVAIGTVSDLMPLVEENRIILKEALPKMADSSNLGLRALLNVAEVEKISAGMIGFRIGPRLNAAGRMGDASRGVRLFLSQEEEEAKQIAEELNSENKKRQEMENVIVEEALSEIAGRENLDKILVVSGKGWHHGVIGIVASRLLERFYRPVIVLADEGEHAVGSGRSVEGFNLFAALQQCQDLFVKFGGHEMAAGLTIPSDKIEELRRRINQYAEATLTDEILTPLEKVDFQVNVSEVDIPFIEEVQMLAPYGVGNPEPKFFVEARLSEIRKMGKENQHLRLGLADIAGQMDGVAFFGGEDADSLYSDFSVQVTGNVQINEWRGMKKPQMMLSYYTQAESIGRFALECKRQIDEGETQHLSTRDFGRQDCKELYIRLRQLDKAKRNELSWQEMPGAVGKMRKQDFATAIAALAIFEELEICRVKWKKQGIVFELAEGKKVDLEQSALYAKLIKE